MKGLKLNFKNALVLSLVLHFLFFFFKTQTFISFSDKDSANQKAKKSKSEIKFSLVPKSIPPESQTKKQVVNNELSGKNEKPLDSKFLGEKDQTFNRQTVARKTDIFKQAAKGVETGSETLDKNNVKKQIPQKLSLDQLGIGSGPEKININKFKNKIEKKGDASNGVASGNELLGSKSGISETPGVAANNDYIEDVPLGDATNLNTTEFKYYGFYFRIRQRLEQYWGRTLKEKASNLYKSGRKIASDNDMITSLVITIDKKGKIVDVEIKGSSGIKELDEAAVESFNQAGPFPNPPLGMFNGSNIKIEWGFVVKS